MPGSWRLAMHLEGGLVAASRDDGAGGIDVEAERRIERARRRHRERRMAQPRGAGRERQLRQARAPNDRCVVLAIALGSPAGIEAALIQTIALSASAVALVGAASLSGVDATTSKARALGAHVMVGPQDIPNTGRFAIAADPQGAMFAVFQFTNK